MRSVTIRLGLAVLGTNLYYNAFNQSYNQQVFKHKLDIMREKRDWDLADRPIVTAPTLCVSVTKHQDWSYNKFLARGTFGQVHAGRNISVGEVIVAKIISITPDWKQAILAEFRAIKTFCHVRVD
jgi:hypothetical protein